MKGRRTGRAPLVLAAAVLALLLTGAAAKPSAEPAAAAAADTNGAAAEAAPATEEPAAPAASPASTAGPTTTTTAVKGGGVDLLDPTRRVPIVRVPSLAPSILELLKMDGVRGDMPQDPLHPKPLRLQELMPKLPAMPQYTPPGAADRWLRKGLLEEETIRRAAVDKGFFYSVAVNV